MDLPDSGRVSRDRTYSGTHKETAPLPNTGLSPSMAELSFSLFLAGSLITLCLAACVPHYPNSKAASLGYSAFARRYLRSRDFFLFLRLLRCFTSPRLHREPRDQRLFDSYPRLFAAFHAHYRLLAPRHPPYALNCLIIFVFDSIFANTRGTQE